jgi:aconitate hydratase
VRAQGGTAPPPTTTVFPADDAVRRFLRAQQREHHFERLDVDPGAAYDRHDTLDLSALEPMIAMPSSPDNVVPVREVEGEPIYQAYVGSSANPGYRDFAVASAIVRDRQVAPSVSFDVNPTSRQILENLARDGHLGALIRAGARLHQAGCNGCIGMGQAPATEAISLRTVPRNFPGRSGTREDKVCLVSPETAAASALTGTITDPRSLDRPDPRIHDPGDPVLNTSMLAPPPPEDVSRRRPLVTGPNIAPFPELDPLPDRLELPVLLQVGDNLSTDEILPAGARVLPLRSNIPAIAEFSFEGVRRDYPHLAREALDRAGGHIVVGGENYGQGSSREHAALAPRYLGLRVVIAKSFARIHAQNLANFGVLPLTFAEPSLAQPPHAGHVLALENLRDALRPDHPLEIANTTRGTRFSAHHALSERQLDIIRRGGLIPWMRARLA